MDSPSRANHDRRTSRHVPAWVAFFNAVVKPLLKLGVPMGPEVLLTVAGRRSGLPRTTPVTICEYGDRRGFISPFGETHWVRNLRAAGRGTIQSGRRREEVRAVELDQEEAARFIREVIAPIAAENPVGDWFVRKFDRIDLDHPDVAAVGKPVFELLPTKPPAAANG